MKNNSQKGSALVYAMVAALGVAALSLVFLQRAQTEKRIASKYLADSEIDAAVLDISSFLLRPQHCNATFRGMAMPAGSTAVAVNAIRECNSATCFTGATSSFPVYKPVLNATNMSSIPVADRWKGIHTKFVPLGSSANIESIIRITKAEIRFIKNQVSSGPPSATWAPAIVELTLNFEKKLGAGVVSSDPDVTAFKVGGAVRKILISVITNTYNYSTGTLTPSGPGPIILGCPKTPNSIVIYQ